MRGQAGLAALAALVDECRRPGLPGIVPSERLSLAAVPGLLLAELARCERGVIVLGVDGLSHGVAGRCWATAELSYLTSTFPSTSATAWLTALTGRGPVEHGVPGMVHRVGPGLVHAVTGETLAGDPPGGVRHHLELVRPRTTVFERAAGNGVRCLSLGRELDHLSGPWARALLRGAAPAGAATPDELAEQAAAPDRLVAAVSAQVRAVTCDVPAGERTLLWTYVNLDDHIHACGYDAAVVSAMEQVDELARSWAASGWTVVAHSDHGQVPVRPDPELARAWASLDDPAECELPAGGAGRVRWLHPRPGRELTLRARLADVLGDAAVVLPAAALTAPSPLALPPSLALPPRRVGAVVAIAASERFPVPDPSLRYEHGATDVDEMIIPFAVWRPAPARPPRPTRAVQAAPAW